MGSGTSIEQGRNGTRLGTLDERRSGLLIKSVRFQEKFGKLARDRKSFDGSFFKEKSKDCLPVSLPGFEESSTVHGRLIPLLISPIKRKYSLVKGKHGGQVKLNDGSSCRVFLAKGKQDNSFYAIKRVDIEKYKKSAQHELHALRMLDHPRIVRLKESYLHKSEIMFVLEYCAGNDLFTYSHEHPNLNELTIHKLTLQMLETLDYLHAQGIAHRDIKLENWAFRDNTYQDLVLIDFGLAEQCRAGERPFSKKVGTKYFQSPEVIQRKYGMEGDVWAIGVTLYVLASSYLPFVGETDEQILESMKADELDFSQACWKKFSPAFIDFVQSLLMFDMSARRSTVKLALAHPWIESIQSHSGRRMSFMSRSFPPRRSANTTETCNFKPVLERLRIWSEQPIFKRLALYCTVLNTPYKKLEKHAKTFLKFRASQDGLSYWHFTKIVSDAGYGREYDTKAVFDAINITQSGNIEWSEFAAAFLEQVDESMARATFESLTLYDMENQINVPSISFLMEQTISLDPAETITELSSEKSMKESFRSEISYREFVDILKQQH